MRALKPTDILINTQIIKRFISTLTRNRVPIICTSQGNIHRCQSTENSSKPTIPRQDPKSTQQHISEIIIEPPKPRQKRAPVKDWNTPDYFKRERCEDGEYPHDTHGNLIRGLDTLEVKELLSDPENLKEFFRAVPGEFKKWKDNIREFIKEPPLIKDHEKHIEMLFTFDSEEKIDLFNVTTDASHDVGYSTASFTMTNSGSGLFSGYLCNKLRPDGQTPYAGYVNINSKRAVKPFWEPGYYDIIENYNHFVLKVRGDGRTYGIIVATPGHFNDFWCDQWHYPLLTRGGPYWQIVKIPFSKFYFAPAGDMDGFQGEGLQFERVARIGITLADRIEGPYSLEIDYIGLQNKPEHHETFAYESYNTPYPAYF